MTSFTRWIFLNIPCLLFILIYHYCRIEQKEEMEQKEKQERVSMSTGGGDASEYSTYVANGDQVVC